MKNSESIASHALRAPQDDRVATPSATGNPGNGTESSPTAGYVYRFGQFTLDSRKRILSRAGSPVILTAKAFDVLLFLTQHPNRLVAKEELLKGVWGDTFVEEGNLTQYISMYARRWATRRKTPA